MGGGWKGGPCSKTEEEPRRHKPRVDVRGPGAVSAAMKLKQRVVVLCVILLLLGLAKIFLLDGGEGSVASRRDLRAFRKVGVLAVGKRRIY